MKQTTNKTKNSRAMTSDFIEIGLMIAGILTTGAMVVSLMALSMVAMADSAENSTPARSMSKTDSVMAWQSQGVGALSKSTKVLSRRSSVMLRVRLNTTHRIDFAQYNKIF